MLELVGVCSVHAECLGYGFSDYATLSAAATVERLTGARSRVLSEAFVLSQSGLRELPTSARLGAQIWKGS